MLIIILLVSQLLFLYADVDDIRDLIYTILMQLQIRGL